MHMELKTLKPRLGSWLTIEELKEFFTNVPDDIGEKIPINRRLLEVASEFVEERRGWWEHPDWEGFLGRLHNEGFNLSEELKGPIGNILEIFKTYYHSNNFKAVLEKCRKQAAPKASNARTCSSRKNRAVKEA
jgi:hypothetical protein